MIFPPGSLNFCGMYLKDVDTAFNRPQRNNDGGVRNEKLSVFAQSARPFGDPARGESLSRNDMEVAHWFVLNNCDEIMAYLDEHEEMIKREHPSHLVANKHRELFPQWFLTEVNKLKSLNSPTYSEELYNLAFGPIRAELFSGGGESTDIDFYGKLTTVVQLLYKDRYQVIMFKCRWFDTNPNRQGSVKIDHGLLSVNINRTWYDDDPYILANMATQIVYLDDPKVGNGWKVVQKMDQRNVYAIPELDPTDNEVDNVADQRFESSMENDAETLRDTNMSNLIRSRKAVTIARMSSPPTRPSAAIAPARDGPHASCRINIGYDERHRAATTAELHSSLAHDIGHVIRAHCPMKWKSWKVMPDETRMEVRGQLSANYNLEDLNEESLTYVNRLLGERYKQWKSDLHHHFQTFDDPEVALREGCPQELEGREDSWAWLCSHFQEGGYLKAAQANKGNRNKKTLLHHSGSRPFSYRMDARRREGSKFPEIDVFGDVYVRLGNELAESLYTTMVEKSQLVLQESASQLPPDTPLESVDPPHDAGFQILTETLDQTLGRRPGTYCRGMGNARRRESRARSASQSNDR
ncbi:unnamed protein product [Prunus brigantina]